MRKIAILLTTSALLLTVWLIRYKVAEAERNPLFTEVIVETSPTPPKSKTEKPEVSPSPIPVCSPMPSPLSGKDKNNPLRELTLEDFVNIGVGTPDFDCDGICNLNDNCPSIYNPDQKDSNADGKGDACDPKIANPSFTDSRCDMDGDGVPDIKDNCPSACNPDQKFVDVNENKVNDLCDSVLPNFAFNKPCVKRKKTKPHSHRDSDATVTTLKL